MGRRVDDNELSEVEEVDEVDEVDEMVEVDEVEVEEVEHTTLLRASVVVRTPPRASYDADDDLTPGAAESSPEWTPKPPPGTLRLRASSPLAITRRLVLKPDRLVLSARLALAVCIVCVLTFAAMHTARLGVVYTAPSARLFELAITRATRAAVGVASRSQLEAAPASVPLAELKHIRGAFDYGEQEDCAAVVEEEAAGGLVAKPEPPAEVAKPGDGILNCLATPVPRTGLCA